MRATCWYGKKDVRSVTTTDPKILNPRDAVVRVTLTAICGSDLHLFNAKIPSLKKGDILGHEFMGEVMEVGSAVKNLKVGDRVVVPFHISCGNCFFCQHELYSLCDNSNPNAFMEEGLYEHPNAGAFGYAHMYGGYAGGQAEFVRVPYADTGALKIPEGIPDEKVLFLSDIFPTGFMAADNCNIRRGDTVAVWGAGPVGQFAIQSAFLLGAERVIAIDDVPERLAMVKENSEAEVLNREEVEVRDALGIMTGGRGPDACIDAVGMEGHGSAYDAIKTAVKLEMDRPFALRQAIQACRSGGTVSVPGVYGGFIDKFPFGAVFSKALTIKSGQTHVHKYMRRLLQYVLDGKIDPSFVITHRLALGQAPVGYENFNDKKPGWIKVVLQPA
jgi:threonine dehydrogenase-like Zn-dependent dehydrogenase